MSENVAARSDSESSMTSQSTSILTATPFGNALQPFFDIVTSVYEALRELLGSSVKFVFWISFIAVPTFVFSCAVYYLFYWSMIPQGKFIDEVDFDFTIDPPTDIFYLQQPKWQSCLGPHDGLEPILRIDEHYDVMLRMNIPTTPQFLALEKTVMIRLILKTCEGEVIAQAARGFVPQYYNSWSHLVHRSFIFLPSAFGLWTESITIWLPLMKDFVETSNRACLVEISMSEPTLHLYKSELAFSLLLSGYRRVIRDWFVSSSVVGISSIFSTLMCGIAIFFLVTSGDDPDEEDIKADDVPAEPDAANLE